MCARAAGACCRRMVWLLGFAANRRICKADNRHAHTCCSTVRQTDRQTDTGQRETTHTHTQHPHSHPYTRAEGQGAFCRERGGPLPHAASRRQVWRVAAAGGGGCCSLTCSTQGSGRFYFWFRQSCGSTQRNPPLFQPANKHAPIPLPLLPSYLPSPRVDSWLGWLIHSACVRSRAHSSPVLCCLPYPCPAFLMCDV